MITEPIADGQIVSAADVHMETGPFSDADPDDQHLCSDFEIWSLTPATRVWSVACIAGIEKLHVHFGDGAFEGSHAGRTELLPDTDYQVRARHRDDSGDPATEYSAWAVRSIHTAPARETLPDAPGWVVLQPGYKVELVASGFQLPVNIAFLPEPRMHAHDPLFYVTELYGTIKVVTTSGEVSNYATGLINFEPTGDFPGSGEQGLSGIVVEPTTGDVFAAVLYDADGPHYPKVIRFHSTDGGLTAAGPPTTVLDMPGETQGQSHFISNLSIGPDGKLYVHMGDGFVSSTALDMDSFRGKILRVNLDGTAPEDNPFYNLADGIDARDYIWVYGVRNPFGGTWRRADGAHYWVENGPNVDRFARAVAGQSYGWDGTEATMRTHALYNWEPAHAPVNLVFAEPQVFAASGFPASVRDWAFISESGPTWAKGPQNRGKRISALALAGTPAAVVGDPAAIVEYNGSGRSTVVGLAAGPDGLYFSDLYKENENENPIAPGANVYRLSYVGVPSGTGLRAEYYDALAFAGTPIVRQDATINFDWAALAPIPGMDSETFSVRWTGEVLPEFSEEYTFVTASDDAVRVWVNNVLVVDAWTPHSAATHSGKIQLVAGQRYAIRVDYFDAGADALIRLQWSSASQPVEVVPADRLFAPPG